MYFASAVLALCVALVCTFFSFIAGSGWAFLLPSALSVPLLAAGIAIAIRKPVAGAWISGFGAVVCSLVIFGDMIQLIQAIPFQRYPQQSWMLVPPGIFLVVILTHIVLAVSRVRDVRNREMWKGIRMGGGF
jgi:hypothetical protein